MSTIELGTPILRKTKNKGVSLFVFDAKVNGVLLRSMTLLSGYLNPPSYQWGGRYVPTCYLDRSIAESLYEVVRATLPLWLQTIPDSTGCSIAEKEKAIGPLLEKK